MEPLLKVKNLEKRYESGGVFRTRRCVVALRGVSFALYPKTTLALVGESGSGKTTLALCLTCQQPATAGSIVFDGHDLTGLNEKELRALRPQIQLVFQDPASSLNPRLSILDTVTEPLDLRGKLNRAEKVKRARDLLDRVALPQNLNLLLRTPDELSGGQKQRVAMARALALRPKLLILDEALSSLDCSTQAQIANLLLELQSSMGLTYLFITHDLRMAAHLSDQIAVMENGQIAEFGDVARIVHNPAESITRRLLRASLGMPPIPAVLEQV